MQDYESLWQDAVEAMFELGDYAFFIVRAIDVSLEQLLIKKDAVLLGMIEDVTKGTLKVYLKPLSNSILRRKTWLRLVMNKDLYRIESSFTCKFLCKPTSWPDGVIQRSPWIPGINLCTFKMCRGVYPSQDQLCKSLRVAKDLRHTDWLINNMILQGSAISLIDGDDLLSKRYFSDALLKAHQEVLVLEDPRKVEHYFWYKLTKVPTSVRQSTKFFSKLFPAFSLVFDIGSPDKRLIERYLGYGTKLVASHMNPEMMDALYVASTQEQLSLVQDIVWEDYDNQVDINYLIDCYGMPSFCCIHLSVDTVFDSIKTMTMPIRCIAFKFDVRSKASLIACLNHLVVLGYEEFNFSSRDIPGFILEDNRYLGTKKTWVRTLDQILDEIEDFQSLDHDGDKLWGYVYALCNRSGD